MRKSFYPACILALALSVGKAHAQTGIAINDNNATADPSAMLDVSVSATAKKGFLLPRMTTTQRDVIASPAKGLLIYVTNVDSLEINIGTPASPKWFAFGNGSSTVSGWQLKGNTGTNIATDFVGTADNVDLAFRTNNFERLRISNLGNVGIGVTAPAQKLDVNGAIKFSGPLMPNNDPGIAGYFLVSAGGAAPPVWFNAAGYAWLIDGNTVATDKKFGTISNNNLPFITNNIERMRITNAGFVGIGTTTPTNTLHVSAASNPLALTGVQNGVITDSLLSIDPTTGVVRRLSVARFQGWSYGGDAVAAITNLGTTTNFDLPFITNSTERMRIANSGKITMGTTSIANTVSISSSSNPLTLTGVQNGVISDSLLSIDPTTGVVRRLSVSRFSGWSYNGDAVTANTTLGTTSNFDLPFIANNTEWMRLTKTGNFGIGTPAAGNKLTVVATNPLALYGVQVGTTTSSDSVLTITSGIVKKVPMSSFSTSSSDWKLTGNSGTSAGTNFVGTTDDVSLMFKINGNEAGYIGNSANGFTVELGSNASVAKWGGTYAVAVGANSTASNTGATSLGGKATSAGNATAVGYNANANQEAVAIGANATTNGNESVAIGTSSATNFQSVSVGKLATSAQSGVAIGYNASTTAMNTVAIGYSSATGGQNSSAIGPYSKASGFQANAFGYGATASGQSSSAFGGVSVASGYQSTSIGLGSSATGGNATALGANATAANDNTVVIGNKTVSVLMNDAAYDATKALVVGSKNSNGNGAYLTVGGAWTNASDRNLKENITKVSSADVLTKIMALDVLKWKYKGTNEYHIGPMAQDFFAAFSLGTDDKHISSVDPAGVALVAIQELKKENEELSKRVDDQQKLLEQLLKEVNELKAKVK
ncbi:tail fiber domain-containing protein [Chitinophagaceae bacterium 26-R-25]|nr:tail fiber domain-containing protein [Chitinophagaceae bacterium 26-R-25]